MTTLKDLFLDVIEDARHVRTWQEAVDLHEHTKILVSDFGKRQGLYSADKRLELIKLCNEALTKVRNVLHHEKIASDVAAAAEARQRHATERAERLEAIDRELAEAVREREALDQNQSRSFPRSPLEGVTGNALTRALESRHEREQER
ncbi:hypothetical protein ACIBG0_21075 [Nocardia sp. NPDC050630]|uniref:hypothetical protein n=1 Tax=Nocardia sp. NPDC050630 TaxID=3364321 RepID=UPI003792F819